MSPEDRAAQAAPPPAPAPGSVYDLFAKALPGVEMNAVQGALDVLIDVKPADVENVLRTAKTNGELGFDFLRNLSGVDYEDEGLEVVYHLYSYKNKHNVTIRCRLPKDAPTIKTASSIWRAADWHEREARDMFGIVFEGHPNLVPLLLPDDMTDHFPLLKSNPLAPLEEWQGELLGSGMGNAGYIPPGSGFAAAASAEGE